MRNVVVLIHKIYGIKAVKVVKCLCGGKRIFFAKSLTRATVYSILSFTGTSAILILQQQIIPWFCKFFHKISRNRKIYKERVRDTQGGVAVAQQWSDSGTWSSPTSRVFLFLRSKMRTTWWAKENSWSERSERRTPKFFMSISRHILKICRFSHTNQKSAHWKGRLQWYFWCKI